MNFKEVYYILNEKSDEKTEIDESINNNNELNKQIKRLKLDHIKKTDRDDQSHDQKIKAIKKQKLANNMSNIQKALQKLSK